MKRVFADLLDVGKVLGILACVVYGVISLISYVDWRNRPFMYYLEQGRPPLEFPNELQCMRHLNASLGVEKSDWLAGQRCQQASWSWKVGKGNTWFERGSEL